MILKNTYISRCWKKVFRPNKIDYVFSVKRARPWNIAAFSFFLKKLRFFIFLASSCIKYIFACYSGSDPTEKYLPSTLENVEKQDSGIRFPVTAQTAKNVGLLIHCTECKKPRCLYAQYVLKNQQPVYAKRMIQKVDYVCGASLSEYVGSGGDKDEQLLKVLFVRENLSCSSMIELPYYGVPHYPIVCVHCGVTGTKRTLNTTAENYPKCNNCDEKPDVVRRKRKTLVQTDLGSKRKKWMGP